MYICIHTYKHISYILYIQLYIIDSLSGAIWPLMRTPATPPHEDGFYDKHVSLSLSIYIYIHTHIFCFSLSL